MPKKFIYKPPKEVTAQQWLPDSRSAVSDMVDWLMSYGKPFRIRMNDNKEQVLEFQSRDGDEFDQSLWPGEWLVKEGPGAWASWEDSSFKANHDKK